MGFTTKIRFNKDKIIQASNEEVILSGKTTYDSDGQVYYKNHPTFTGATQIVDKKYVDDHLSSGVTSSLYYTGETPSNIAVGGMPAGDVLTGRTLSNIIEDMTHTYYVPTFTAFNIGLSSTHEVGYTVPPTSTATWSTSHPENIATNSIMIIDVTYSNAILAQNLNNDGSESVSLTSKTFSPNGSTVQTYTWGIRGTNTENNQMAQRNYSIHAYQPWFWGKVYSSTETRPTATQDLINGGTKVIADSSGNINVTFNSGDDDYLWFAIPASSTPKTYWYIASGNEGDIGGDIGTGSAYNLFPDPDILSISDPSGNWSGVNYRIYISNWRTSTGSGKVMQIRNSQLIMADVLNTIEELQNVI